MKEEKKPFNTNFKDWGIDEKDLTEENIKLALDQIKKESPQLSGLLDMIINLKNEEQNKS